MSRGSGRIDVVDEHHPRRGRSHGGEAGLDVVTTLRPGELPLPRRPAHADEQRLEGTIPGLRELARQRLGRVMAALQPPVGIGGDERQAVGVAPRQGVRDDRGRPPGESAQAALLPRADDPPNGRVVFDGTTRAGEGQAPPGALDAAEKRPRSRRAAAGAQGRNEPPQRRCARGAHLRAGTAADEAALRQEQIEHDDSTVVANVLRDCVALVPEEHQCKVGSDDDAEHDAEHHAAGHDQPDHGPAEEHGLDGDPRP